MGNLRFAGKWILVTGASSGLGLEMAKQLAAKHGAHIIAVARRTDKLKELQHYIETHTSAQIKTITADLSNVSDIDRVVAESTQGGNLYAAILNAGITYFGPHIDLDWEQCDKLIQTNVHGMVRMATGLTQYFESNQNEGGIMIVSSMAAVLPTPYQAVYSGTKGFMLNFITALSHEVTNKNLSYTVYLPGGMATEMTNNDKFSPLKNWLMPVETAAKIGLEALRKRKRTCVPGTTNRLGAIVSAIIPKHIIVKGMAKTYGKALKGK
jgi:short-subunit dehydrogenase